MPSENIRAIRERMERGSVAIFSAGRNDLKLWTQLSSECRELLKCGLTREVELPFAYHVRDFNAFQCCRS
jgi:hypothetical protein